MTAQTAADILVSRHLRSGWWSLLVFLTLGIVLEALHGFKLGWYLDVGNETRRLMWTLAHAHGALLGVLNLGFAFTVRELSGRGRDISPLASPSLLAATVLLPAGFFLGGAFPYGADPGPGILLLPLGALALFAAVLVTALGAGRSMPGS